MRRRYYLPLLGLGLGCQEPSSVTRNNPNYPLAVTNTDSTAETVAAAIALALQDPTTRIGLLQDLRDAPAAHHSIHLPSYLSGTAGRALATRIAERLEIPVNSVHRMLGGNSGLEILVTRPMDRAFWKGEPDIVVIGQTKSTSGFNLTDSARVFDLNGGASFIHPSDVPRNRLIVVRPIETNFGNDPEGARLKATHKNRPTISTSEEELRELEGSVGTHLEEDLGGGGLPVGHVLPTYFTTETCRGPGPDSDGDGLLDQCEYEFAATFPPQLSVSNDEGCNGREPYWSVAPTPGVYRSVRIFYALSYYSDCGAYGHNGDSEFIILRVDEYSSSGSWRLYNVTLSAHWHHWLGDRTGTYASSDIQYGNDVQFGRPLVWVSKNKHANYRSQSICNAVWYYPVDNCNDSHLEPVDVLSGFNIGQTYGQTVNTVYSYNSRPGVEKFYDTFFQFCGWWARTGTACATAYNDMLVFYGF